jgi:PAS domain S-box-containing protein
LPPFLRFSFSTRVALALSIGLGILLALAVFGFYSVGEYLKIQDEAQRLLLVRENLGLIRHDIERAESAHIRYQLTANPADQIEYGQLTQRTLREIENLRTILVTQDQRDRLKKFSGVVRSRFDALAAVMRKPGSGDAPLVPASGEPGAGPDKEVRAIANAIAERERQMTSESGERAENLVRLLSVLALCGGAIAVTLLAWTVFVINRYERDRQRAVSELSSAQERLAFALLGSNSAAWDWDLVGNEIYLGAGWSQLLGGEARETRLTPAELLALVHPDDVGRVQSAIKGVLSGTNTDYSEEHRVRGVKGGWIWILSRGMVVTRDDTGRALRITGTNQDITARKSIEMTLKEHDLRLQLALATAGMVRWDWDVAADEFIWPEEPWRLAGPAPRDGHLGLRDMVHPEDLVHFIRVLNQTVQTGEPYRDEYRLTRTDGKVVWVSARGYAVRDADGRVTRVIGVAQDVSDIKQAEQALRESEKELRLITDAVPAFISYADSGETLRFCNKALAAFVGARPEDLVGRPLRELYGEDVYRKLQPHAQRALAGETVQFQRRQVTRDGSAIELDVTYIPRYGVLGEVEGFYALLTDITELKRLDRMKSEFVATVSHELRTPLTSIRGSLGILAGGVAGPLSDKVMSFITIAKDNCERLIRLINDILDMEKIESGKMTLQTQVLDLTELIEQAMTANEGFASQHGVQLRTVSTFPGAQVHADRDRLAQVLTNLISNACKFSPPQSSVDVAVSAHGERVRVDIIDRGPGISEAFRQRIFQKFSQEDSSDMRQKGGTGLGLSISKAIVEGLGGEIGFETEEGKGSAFYFYLPLWREPAAAPSAGAKLLDAKEPL